MYTASHGAYGLVWLLKHCAFPDNNWNQKQTLLGAVNSFLLVLGPYWLSPYLLISRSAPSASILRCSVAVAVSTLGMVIMIAADAQKSFTLKYKKGLIRSGMFALVRHPNYTGEMMIYSGFAGMVDTWLVWAVLAWVWIEVFHTNILFKEASMSRYPEWAEYKARTGLLLPWLPSMFQTIIEKSSKSK